MSYSLIVAALTSLAGAADTGSPDSPVPAAIASEAIDTQAVLKSVDMMGGGRGEAVRVGPLLGVRVGSDFLGLEFRKPGASAGFRWMLSGRIGGFSERIREEGKVVGSKVEINLRGRAGLEWNSEVRQGFDAVVGFGPSILSANRSVERDTTYPNSGGAVVSNERKDDEIVYALTVNLGVRRWFVERRFALRAEVEAGPEFGRERKGLREPEWNLGLDMQF